MWTVGVFHLYGGFFKKTGHTGNFLKVSVKSIQTNLFLLKKSKVNSILIFTKFCSKKNDASSIKFNNNNCVLLKKRLQPFGKEVHGPINKEVSRKKFLYSFSGII